MARARAGQMQTEILSDWSRGIVSDIAAPDLPANAVIFSVDFLFDRPGIAYKRGGSVYASDDLTGAANIQAVAYAPFTAGTKIVAISEPAHRHLYTFTPSSSTDTDVATLAAGFPPISPPVFFNNLLLIPAADGTTSMLKYDGSAAPTSLAAGSSPASKYLTVWLSRVFGAGGNANPRRIYASPTPSPDVAWDTTNAWMDADAPVTALATTPAGLLAFSDGAMELFSGTKPPPGSDLSHRTIANIGCTDARSVVSRNGRALFANQYGVFITDGTSEPVNLVAAGGIQRRWTENMTGYSTGTHVIAAGALTDRHYYVNVLSSGALVMGWLLYLPSVDRPVWQRIDNHVGYMFASSTGINSELYMADRERARVQKLSGWLTQPMSDGTAETDADGDAINPIMYLKPVGGPGLQHYDRARITYKLVDTGGGTPPTFSVAGFASQQTISGSETSFGSLADSGGSSAPSGPLARSSLDIAIQSPGLILIIAHSSEPSTVAEIHAIEVDYRPFPLGAVA